MTGLPLVAVRHALIIGAAEPLARPLAVALARHGATVSIAALTADRDEVTAAHSILNECWSLGRDGQAVELAAAPSAASALAALEGAVGPFDLAVAFAPAALDVLGAAGERMRERGAGRVVFVGESAGAGPDTTPDLAAAERWAGTHALGPVHVEIANAHGSPPERLLELVAGDPEASR